MVITESGMLITSSGKVALRGIELLSGPVELELSLLSKFGQLGGSLLRFEKCVVVRFDTAISIAVLLLSNVVEVEKAVDFLLVTGSLLLLLVKLEGDVVDVFPENVAGVGLLLDIPGGGVAFSLTSGDLVAASADLTGEIVVVTVLLVEEESGVVDLLLEALQGDQVRVVSGFEVVILQQLLIL